MRENNYCYSVTRKNLKLRNILNKIIRENKNNKLLRMRKCIEKNMKQ